MHDDSGKTGVMSKLSLDSGHECDVLVIAGVCLSTAPANSADTSPYVLVYNLEQD